MTSSLLTLSLFNALARDVYDRELAQHWLAKLYCYRMEPVKRRKRYWNHRVCETCGVKKTLQAFHIQPNLPKGRAYHCKDCWNRHMQQRDGYSPRRRSDISSAGRVGSGRTGDTRSGASPSGA